MFEGRSEGSFRNELTFVLCLEGFVRFLEEARGKDITGSHNSTGSAGVSKIWRLCVTLEEVLSWTIH